MTFSVVLPRMAWGSPEADRHALLIHGLGSSAALMWRIGTELADAGWYAVAVDLRGHGRAPRTLDYTLEAYGADVANTHPDAGGSWDLVVGHSLGGAAATIASAANPDWARRLVLLDPALWLSARDHEIVRSSQEATFRDPSAETVREEHPAWHPLDWDLKAQAAALASPWAIAQTSAQNQTWDVRDAAARVRVPVGIIASDPKVYSLFAGEVAAGIVASNSNITMTVVAGAGHSLHRDNPDATLAELRGFIA